jgi:NAD-dependent dihydropyrimidine dehydrogenase PreA subunit
MDTEYSQEVRQPAPQAGNIEATEVGAPEDADKPCCCCAVGSKRAEIVQRPPSTSEPWVMGTLNTSAGVVPRVSTTLCLADHLGTWRVRCGIGRMQYKVDPGLYAVEMDGQKARIVNRDDCMECGACARNCPTTAIAVHAGIGCVTAIIKATIRGTEPTCTCSGSPSESK